jgi:hypothetical protein
MLKFAIFTVSVLAAAPALAQATPAAPPVPGPQAAAANQKANPLDKMVCRYEDTLGSRLGRHKVCATVREWKDQEDDNRSATEKIQQQGYGIPTSG